MTSTRFAMYRDATRRERNQGLDLNGYIYLVLVHGNPTKMFMWNNSTHQWERTTRDGGARFKWEYLPHEIREIAERELPEGDPILSGSDSTARLNGSSR